MTEEGWVAKSSVRKNAMENRFQGLFWRGLFPEPSPHSNLISVTPEFQKAIEHWNPTEKTGPAFSQLAGYCTLLRPCYDSSAMSTTELIDKIKTLPLEERKAVLKILSEELEEEVDTRLYDERTKEPDGRTLAQILSAKKMNP